MKIKHQPSYTQKGFTIIELMIATVVLSVILLLVTTIMISIGNLFYKGVNQAQVQDDVRTITDDLTQNLQLAAAANIASNSTTLMEPNGVTVSENVYCIGNTRYTYILGIQIGGVVNDAMNTPLYPAGSGPGDGATFHHVLWRDLIPNVDDCTPADLTSPTPSGSTGSDGIELITPHSRLTQFSISSATSPYNISVGVAFGDNDLLNNYNNANATCKGNTGDQFCSTTSLMTTIIQREVPSN